MLEWPEGFGLAVQFFGLLVFITLNLAQLTRLQSVLVGVILILAFGHYLWIVPRGISASALLSYDQRSLAFTQSFLGLLFFTHIFSVTSSKLKLEAAPFQIAFSLLGSMALLSNNLILQVLLIPVIFAISLLSPKMTQSGQSTGSVQTTLNWSLLILLIVSIAAGFIYLGSGTFQLNTMKATDPVIYLVGWSLLAVVIFCIILFFPIGLLIEDHIQSRDWFTLSTYRIGAGLIFTGIFVKWSILAPSFIAPIIFETVAIVFTLSLVVSLLLSQNILFVTMLFSFVPMTFLFWGIVKPELMAVALPALFFVSLGVPRLLRSFILLDINPSQKTQNLSEALRVASFWSRLEIFSIFLVFMPFGTFFGFNILVKLPISASVCAASLTLVLVIVLGRILQVSSDHRSIPSTLDRWESVAGIMSLVSLIVLGIYPTPLYNYINFLTAVP